MIMRWTQNGNVSWLEFSQLLRVTVNDRNLLVGQQRQEPIGDEMLRFAAGPRIAFASQLDDLQRSVRARWILCSQRRVIFAKETRAERVHEIHAPRIGEPGALALSGVELVCEGDREPRISALKTHDRLFGVAHNQRMLGLARQ